MTESLIQRIHDTVDGAVREGGFTPSRCFLGYSEVAALVSENEISSWSNHADISFYNEDDRHHVYELVLDGMVEIACPIGSVRIYSVNIHSMLAVL